LNYPGDMSELNADDAFMNAGTSESAPRNPKTLKRIVGFGSSRLVGYEGTGAYFLDKVREGVWRLEVYPDEVLVSDPFEQPQPDKVVSRLLYRSWPMRVLLPDLGGQFFATPVNIPADRSAATRKAANAKVTVEPGIWLLHNREQIDQASLPARIDRVNFSEYHVNQPVAYPDFVVSLAPKEYMSGSRIEIRARVANSTVADEVNLWIRAAGMRFSGKAIPMARIQGNDYAAVIEPGVLAAGVYEYAISTKTGARATTFPGAVPRQPVDWPFRTDTLWSFRVTPPGAPMRLLDPKEDYRRLSFVRPGEQYRTPFFQIAPGESADESALSLALPDLGNDTPQRYAAALFIGDIVAARKADVPRANSLDIKLHAVGGARKTILVTLIEQDGSAWSASAVAGNSWSTVNVPLDKFRISRSIHIPSPFPGLWNYWREGPPRRGLAGDRIRVQDVERLQLTVTPNTGENANDDARGAAVESIRLTFAGEK